MSEPYLLIITGHSCSGKSTLIKELQKSLTGSYHIGYDKVKWWIAGYNRDRDIELVKGLLSGFLWVIFEVRIPCITDAHLRTEDEYHSLCDRAESHGYKIFTVRLDCPEDIRLERFRERVARSQRENIPMSLTDETVFLENMKRSLYFPEDTMVFDTSEIWVEEITEYILSELRDTNKPLDVNFEAGNTS